MRLFEAAACGVAIVSDWWPGLESFFTPGEEILLARSSAEVLRLLTEVDPDELASTGLRARERVLAEHTGERRAQQLEQYVGDVLGAAA